MDRALLSRMAASIVHRGPDGEGLHVDDGVRSVGLASRRLAIIDIPGGSQPMITEDGRYALVYNGEVFNAEELRRELEARSHVFRTRCDTEVVLRGFAEWGTEVVARLNGMWAFAAWDRLDRRLMLARDRLGVKPLVYADTPSGLVFASEIKALFASGAVPRTLDLTALPHYLSSFVVPEPHTFFRNVRRLPAGHYLVADAAGVREVRYWDCAFEEEEDRGIEAYLDEIGGLLEDSVRRRLVSDVPLGVFLSAGIDSALVAAFASKRLSEPLRTFTLGFAEAPDDERAGAASLASQLGARHTEEVVTAREAASLLPELLRAHDEPSQSLLQGYLVSRLARRQVTVALSGLGGDELFSSYPTHRVVELLSRLDRVSVPLRGAVLALGRLLGGRRGQRVTQLVRLPSDQRASRWLLHQTKAALRSSLLAPGVRDSLDLEAPVRHLEGHYDRARARHPLNRLLYVYLKTYLPDELLRTLDSMSMALSLEARVPLLDYRLVEAAMKIPARHKMVMGNGKILLRRLARRVLPRGSLSRGKRGFTLPLDIWLRGELTETVRDVLSEATVRHRGIFDATRVAELVHNYLDGDADLVQPVMMLFAFEQWAQRVLDAPVISPVSTLPALSGPPPSLSVIIVNWNTREILRNCLASVEAHLAAVSHEVLVVDNASSDGSAETVERDFPGVRLLRNSENVGFARANNQAMKLARGEWFLLLNSDTLLTDESVARLFERVRSEPGLGVAQCRLLMADGRLQHSTNRFPSLKLALLEDLALYKLLPRAQRGEILLAGYWDHARERDVDWVSGAFMLLPRQVFEKTGGFSEAYFMYGEDMEWCHRVQKAGYRIRYYPDTSIIHLDHSSSAIRWGERRVAICIERQIRIYELKAGRARAILFNLIRTTGMFIRLAYFSLRSAWPGRQLDYHRTMKRYYALSLRVHARLAVGRR